MSKVVVNRKIKSPKYPIEDYNLQDESKKVSIITPMYNSEKFIADTINSVLSQTYINWEMLIVDDCSTDASEAIVKEYCNMDARIKYLKTEIASGSPTLPRNIGIEKSVGRFISFLDSDDLWFPEKLASQIPLFLQNNTAIVFSNYEKISECGTSNDRFINAPSQVSYDELLKGNVIACLTCMYDTNTLGKQFFNNQGHEDFALWLSILRKGFIARNTGTVLAKYRVRSNSISSNKLKAITWVYRIFRHNEKLSLAKTFTLLAITFFRSFIKYIK